MKTLMILQADGANVLEYIERLKPTRVRLASAYVSQETIRLLDRFKNVDKRLLFDYDPGRLTAAFLKTLVAAQPTGVYVAERSPLFHPKIFIFDDSRLMHLFIGSSNATRGGLRNNFETMFYHTLDRGYDAPAISDVELLWQRLARIANTRLTPSFISRRASELATSIPPPRRGSRAQGKPIPPGQGLTSNWSLPIHLQKIIGKETGTDGTQVQFSIDIIKHYFGNDGIHSATVQIIYKNRFFRTSITHHPNDTHRISMAFLAGIQRPALLRLDRVSANVYVARLQSRNTAAFGRLSNSGRAARSGANPYRYF